MEKIFIHAEDLLRDALELGMRVVRSGFRPTFLVGIWRGGAPIGITVQEVLEFHGLECDHLAIRTSSYTGIDQQAKTVRVHAIDYLVSRLTAEDRLLLIDDVFDTGLSLEAVINELRRRCRRNMPGQVRIATTYFKPSRNRSALMPISTCARRTNGSCFLTRCRGSRARRSSPTSPSTRASSTRRRLPRTQSRAETQIVYKVGARCVQAGAHRLPNCVAFARHSRNKCVRRHR